MGEELEQCKQGENRTARLAQSKASPRKGQKKMPGGQGMILIFWTEFQAFPIRMLPPDPCV